MSVTNTDVAKQLQTVGMRHFWSVWKKWL